MENIYKRLANGESSESIAAEFTAALNEAMARHAKEEEERAAREAEARARKAQEDAARAAKCDGMADLIDAMFRYLAKHYPALGIEDGDWDRDREDLRAVAELVVLALDMETIKITKAKPAVETKSTDDVFTDFFRQFGLLS